MPATYLYASRPVRNMRLTQVSQIEIYSVAMNFDAPVRCINLFAAGMLAGVEVGIHYGIGTLIKTLGVQGQIQLRQAMVLRLRVLVPVFFVSTALTAVAVTVLGRNSPGYLFRYAGLLTLFVWIVTRAVGTIPINIASLAWDAAAPPADWSTRVERAEMFHILGMWAAVAVFALFLAAAAMKQSS